ncbi:hypothetical protein P154DRAFT_520156 [Amniculicola lignicola CBS 123094]|uniref:Uncharacterized protein n=1 Tax=Amniculicola lignicola CBS 123094 TaxID=1392246 RepID=A0A6A5WQ60_9PLEO|nr:hypothetical protein P154DRAFT_520156 [Amniculicola lignicola CBS 123094]
MNRPFFEAKPISYSEVYSKFANLDSVNNKYQGRFRYGFEQGFKTAQDTALRTQLKMNKGDALDLFMDDKAISIEQKVLGGVDTTVAPHVPVESGSLSRLALQGQNILSAQTRIADRCVNKAEDSSLNSKVRKLYKNTLSKVETKRHELLLADTYTLDDLLHKGGKPDNQLLSRLLYNGFRYWENSGINKEVRRRFYELARERQANYLRLAIKKSSGYARQQWEGMLDELLDNKLSYLKEKEVNKMRKFLESAGEMTLDICAEELGDQESYAFWTLPVLGPALETQPATPETDVFTWIIKAFEKRGLPPPSYDDLKAGQQELSNMLKILNVWLTADSKAFWQTFHPLITSEASGNVPQPYTNNDDGAGLAPVAVGLAEQVLMVQMHSMLAERVDRQKHPWIWELASDRTDLVSELANKYIDEGSEAMYNYVGHYSYRGKRPLSRRVACDVVLEALESILTSITNIDATVGDEEVI